MALSDYLAKNYLNADPGSGKHGKKRKRKEQPSGGLLIADDDANAWKTATANGDEEGGPTLVSGRSSEFQKAKKNNWVTVGARAPSNNDQVAADAIIASTAAENNIRDGLDDERPQIVEEEDEGALQMESGVYAGLQSAAQVDAALERKREKERRRFEKEDAEMSGLGQETIYRDASGRIINVAMKRAEARRKADEEEKKKAAALDAMKGDVQRAEREQRKQQLSDAKYMSVARYADDVDLNEELKEKELWNDPAAQFLTKKKAKQSVTGKPLYQGTAPPNRYGIRPGYRWDGVDRSNGFEKEYFAAQNKRRNQVELEYAWQMDE